MKYQTIVFDVNKPTLKQVKVPLESDYGVAVKVYKDGQPVSADLSVGSVACTEGPNGWKLAELSSGNTPTTKHLPVEASKAPSMSASVSATLSAAAVFSDTQITMNSRVAGVSENLHIESPAWLARPEVKIVFTSQDGSTTERGLAAADQLYITNARNSTPATATAIWNAAAGAWELSPTLNVIYTNSKMWLKVMTPANSTVEVEAVVKVDSGDGIDSKFSLVVQEQDLGYIEF